MKNSNFSSEIQLRKCSDSDISGLRHLVNAAYKELAEMGLNYTATYQDEAKTRERVSKGEAFVLVKNGEMIATILLWSENHFTGRNTAYIGQFAVRPDLKRSGFGTLLIDHCENLARERKFDGVQLDTAKPAAHLVNWYQSRGYKIVGEMAWEGKTYESWIFEKIF